MDQQPRQQNYIPPQQQGYMPPQQPSYMPPQQPPQPMYNNMSYAQNNAEPLTMGQYIVMFILLAIPIVNIVMPFIWAFGNTNINKKNFARAILIMMAIGIVLSVLFSSVLVGIINSAMR